VRPSGVWFWQSLLVSPATMTSADFLAHRNLVYSKISLGKVNILVPIPAISTTSVLPPFRKVWTSVCCATSSDLIASVYGFPIFGTGSVRQYRHRSLAYFTACLTANQLATCLASGRYPRA
ncbi:hypothetical protein, partial [Mongoliibacter ruber]|uniref:hypothetical protein n=1 Tax=Mongoliibacter ruber TaxID=1750599 RepID=UPI001473B998